MHPTVRHFVEDAGRLTQSLGLGQAIGQVFAYLYFSPEPRSLPAIQQALGISKGSASMTVRQLERWLAVRKVLIKGDRKDWYEANDWLGQIVRNVLVGAIEKRLALSNGLFSPTGEDALVVDHPDAAFVAARIKHLRGFQQRVKKVWESPVVHKLVRQRV